MKETHPQEQSGPVVGLMLPAIANTDTDAVDTGRLLEAARRAEAAGFDGVYVGDHLLHPGPILEAIVTLSAVAASTQSIAIGTCIMLIALRDPVWLAKQIGSLASFAPGRLRIGIGIGGEYPPEFEAAGVALAERGHRAEEVLIAVEGLLSGELQPARRGEGPAATIDPRPSQPIPFLFAGWKEVALRRAAELGDGWIGYLLSPESFDRRRSFVLNCRAERGGRPFITGMLLPVHPDPEPEGAHSRAAAGWARVTKNDVSFPERLFVAGPADAIVDQLRRYWDAGCTEFVLSLVDQGDGYLDQLEILSDEVLPRVREFTTV